MKRHAYALSGRPLLGRLYAAPGRLFCFRLSNSIVFMHISDNDPPLYALTALFHFLGLTFRALLALYCRSFLRSMHPSAPLSVLAPRCCKGVFSGTNALVRAPTQHHLSTTHIAYRVYSLVVHMWPYLRILPALQN